MNVSDFKRIVAGWPEEYPDGDPTEVWIMTGNTMSSPVDHVDKLNDRHGVSDMLLFSEALTPDLFGD